MAPSIPCTSFFVQDVSSSFIPHAQSRLHIRVKTAYLDFEHLHFLPVGAKNI